MLREWTASFRAAPLFALALLIYMGLPSSVIFPGGNASVVSTWHLAFSGWYDWVFFSLTTLALVLARQRVPPRVLFICAAFLVSILGSLILGATTTPLANETLFDAMVYWLRFSLTFIFVATLTTNKGIDAPSQIFFAAGLLLMASSIFVFRLQYPEFNRIYASGMTVGSFGQVLLILFLIAMIRNHVGMMLISTAFLILTFSRTALLLWSGSLAYFLFTRSKMRLSQRALYSSLVVVLFAISTIILLRYPEFQSVISERLDLDDIYTMNRRTEVWQYGIDLLLSRSVPFFGIGFNCCPSVLLDFVSISPEDPSQMLYFPSFHSIAFEYAIGLGWLSVPILAFFVWRIVSAWRSRTHLSFYIYTLFLLSQCFDFSFNRPKEVIIWAAFLGLAEGELLRQRKQAAGRSKAVNSMSSPLAQRSAEAATLT
jgi:hypothetical protein